MTANHVQHPPPARRWASFEGAAEYLGVTTKTIRNMVDRKQIGVYRSSRKLVRVDLNEVDAAMQPYGGAA